VETRQIAGRTSAHGHLDFSLGRESVRQENRRLRFFTTKSPRCYETFAASNS